MSAIRLVAGPATDDGKPAEFTEAAAQYLKSAREKETSTLQYDWFLDADHPECLVAPGAQVAASTAELRAATRALGATIYSPPQST